VTKKIDTRSICYKSFSLVESLTYSLGVWRSRGTILQTAYCDAGTHIVLNSTICYP